MTDRIWLKSYPSGVPADIDPGQYPSLVALMEEAFRKHAHKVASVSYTHLTLPTIYSV